MKLDVKIEGADAIREAFRHLPDVLAKKVIDAALRKGAKAVQDDARAAAAQFKNPRPSRKTRRGKGGVSTPYDYGRLRANIRIGRPRRTPKNAKPLDPNEQWIAVGLGNAFWGRFLEFGTKRQRRTPWLTPVAQRTLPTALRIIIKALRDDIELVVAKELRSSVRSAGRGLRRSLGA